MYTVAVCDTEPVAIEGLRSLLASIDGPRVVAAAHSLDDAVEAVCRLQPSLVIVDTWMWSPFMMLISLAGLSAVPPHLYEAAEVDRASGWFKFRWITMPMVAPLLLVALLFRTMDAFKFFDIVYVMTKGAPGRRRRHL